MKLRAITLVFACVILVGSVFNIVDGAGYSGPYNSFTVFPLRGTSNFRNLISLTSSNTKSRYKVSMPMEVVCKADVFVTGYPPSSTTALTFIGVKVLFDPYKYLTRQIQAGSTDYISTNVQCGKYLDNYMRYSDQGYSDRAMSSSKVPEYHSVELLRSMFRQPSGTYSFKWCRSSIVGMKRDLQYRNSIYDITNKNLVYYTFLDSGISMCTNSTSEIAAWQKDGWFLIK